MAPLAAGSQEWKLIEPLLPQRSKLDCGANVRFSMVAYQLKTAALV